MVPPDRACINPLNRRTDEEPASTELNLGYAIPNMANSSLTQLEGIDNARIDLAHSSVIADSEACKPYTMTTSWATSSSRFFGSENYRPCDYGFFCCNIRENARPRAEARKTDPNEAISTNVAGVDIFVD